MQGSVVNIQLLNCLLMRDEKRKEKLHISGLDDWTERVKEILS